MSTYRPVHFQKQVYSKRRSSQLQSRARRRIPHHLKHAGPRGAPLHRDIFFCIPSQGVCDAFGSAHPSWSADYVRGEGEMDSRAARRCKMVTPMTCICILHGYASRRRFLFDGKTAQVARKNTFLFLLRHFPSHVDITSQKAARQVFCLRSKSTWCVVGRGSWYRRAACVLQQICVLLNRALYSL